MTLLLTITYTGRNTRDIGYLLRKNPDRPQSFRLNFGVVHVFYPEISDDRTTVAMLLDIDPIELVKGGEQGRGGKSVFFDRFGYVNDRPYVSSSFMSTAISRVFGTAMSGRSEHHQVLADTPIDLTATIVALPCRSDKNMLCRVFEPLGYTVAYEILGSNADCCTACEDYVNLTIRAEVRLCELLRHVYLLVPVFAGRKHYGTSEADIDKLLDHAGEWLSSHPEKKFIMNKYFTRQRSFVNAALMRLADDGNIHTSDFFEDEGAIERPSQNERRLSAVVETLKKCSAKRVLDMGCGEGELLTLLMKERWITEITGVDVSLVALERAKRNLNYARMSEAERNRLRLLHGSLLYRDKRFDGYDAACVIEVVEHLEPSSLEAFEQNLFGVAAPKYVIVTTPNREYNAKFPTLANGAMRHRDHRFEWTRAEFLHWAEGVATRFGYEVEISGIGAQADDMGEVGALTQMGVFARCN